MSYTRAQFELFVAEHDAAIISTFGSTDVIPAELKRLDTDTGQNAFAMFRAAAWLDHELSKLSSLNDGDKRQINFVHGLRSNDEDSVEVGIELLNNYVGNGQVPEIEDRFKGTFETIRQAGESNKFGEVVFRYPNPKTPFTIDDIRQYIKLSWTSIFKRFNEDDQLPPHLKDVKTPVGLKFLSMFCTGDWLSAQLSSMGMKPHEIQSACGAQGQLSSINNPFDVALKLANDYRTTGAIKVEPGVKLARDIHESAKS